MPINLNSNFKGVPKLKIGLERAAATLIWLVFLGILAWDILVIKQSLDLVMKSNTQAIVDFPKRNQAVTIDFEGFKKVVDRIEQAKSYTPDAGATDNPFWSPPVKPSQ